MSEHRDAAPSIQSLCKGCGAPLLWAQTATGARIPLDARSAPHTYQLVVHEGVAKARPGGAYVSHFLTCPQANTFGTGRKPHQEGQGSAQTRGGAESRVGDHRATTGQPAAQNPHPDGEARCPRV